MTPKQLANILVEDIKPGSWGIINEAIQYNYIIILNINHPNYRYTNAQISPEQPPKEIGAHAIHDSGKGFIWVGILPERNAFNLSKSFPKDWITGIHKGDNSEYGDAIDLLKECLAIKLKSWKPKLQVQSAEVVDDGYLPDTDEWGRHGGVKQYIKIAKKLGIDQRIFEENDELMEIADNIPERGRHTMYNLKYHTLTINKSNIIEIKKVTA